MDKSHHVQAATRVLEVIKALNREPVTSLEALHRRCELPKSTLVRLLETLIAAGYVTRVSRRDGYALTEAVLRLSAGVRHRDVIVDIARPLLEGFTREHKWQISMATYEAESMLVRFTTRHMSPFSREETFLNRRVPLLRSAIGLAYFAHCSADEQLFILKFLAQSDPDQIDDIGGLEALSRLSENIRADGFATIFRPPPDPTRSFAVPILQPGAADGPLGSIVMFYYRSVMSQQEATDKYLGLVRGLADQIGAGIDRAREIGAEGACPAISPAASPRSPA
jgi:IclR family mhp operon transcriptional activator